MRKSSTPKAAVKKRRATRRKTTSKVVAKQARDEHQPTNPKVVADKAQVTTQERYQVQRPGSRRYTSQDCRSIRGVSRYASARDNARLG